MAEKGVRLSAAMAEALYVSCYNELPLQSQPQLTLLQLTLALRAFFPEHSTDLLFREKKIPTILQPLECTENEISRQSLLDDTAILQLLET